MKSFVLSILLVLSFYSIKAQTNQPSFLRYYEYSDMMQAPAGAYKFGLYGFSTPAILTYLHDNDFQGVFNSQEYEDLNGDTQQSQRFGVFTGGPGGGFGVIGNISGEHQVYDYRYAIGFGDKKFGMGFGYGFVGGDKSHFGRSNSWQWSMLWRPVQYVSLAFNQTRSINKNDNESVLQAAVRPIPNYPLAIFADAALYIADKENIYDLPGGYVEDNLRYSYGVSWEVVDGFRVNGRMFSNPIIAGQEIEGDYFSIGVDLSLGTSGYSLSGGSVPTNAGIAGNFVTASYRSGAKDRTIFDDFSIVPKMFYTTLDLKGEIKYQKNIFFDKSKSFLDIITKLDAIKKNDLIKGILVNITGMQTNPSIAWEIREKLKELKENGKTVIIFVERTDLEGYHFASVADKIIIDEMGMITPTGYIMGRSFYKNMLEKLNIGFEEIRLFKYKSAVESFAREDYSEGNREQLQAIVDSWYETTISEIAKDRKKVSREQVDSLVNEKLFYNADDLLEKSFVDKIGRWHDKKDILKEIDSRGVLIPKLLIEEKPEPYDDKWGEDSEGIAVIYAVGVCAMEGGINARKLVEDVKKAVENRSIKAIVIRVDSPGGDALASEYIAQVVRENKDKKPIIVSQGMLAASGGYWLSMDADKIVASPKTITGSIGVISQWIYDKGAASELGITTDKVQVGKYADLGFSWSEPLIGIGIPTRNLTKDERGQWESLISNMYDDFIEKVAEGRDTEKDSIHAIAQGRVWTGADGLKNGLVDEIGGLDYAIKLARKEAGYEENELQNIFEYPSAKSFDFSDIFQTTFGINLEKTKTKYNIVKFSLENNGIPMPMLPIDFWDYYVNE